MDSRHRIGLVLFLLGIVLFLSEKIPGFSEIFSEIFTFPVILIIFGLYLMITKNSR